MIKIRVKKCKLEKNFTISPWYILETIEDRELEKVLFCLDVYIEYKFAKKVVPLFEQYIAHTGR